MRVGDMDRLITLQALALDTTGDPTDGQWVDEATVWAEQVEGVRLRRVISDQDLASAERVYRIRYRTDVTPGWRVQDDRDNYWRVEGASEGEGRRRETILLCARHDPNDREFE